MTKSDLRTGMIVTYSNGRRGMVYLNVCPMPMINSDNVIVTEYGWMNLAEYNEDLTHPIAPDFNIVKIETLPTVHCFITPFDENLNTKVIWECTKKMTISEIEKLLGYKVEIINDK